MFKYTLPCGSFKTFTTLNNGNIKFDPPAYIQRYSMTLQILEDETWAQQIKKVVEFGGADLKFLPLLRRVETVQHIVEVDVDASILKRYSKRAAPLLTDFLKQREHPLRIDLIHGCIAQSAEELRDTDAVIAIEVIEHLTVDKLGKVPETIFGFMQPKLAILTTPNAEFNKLFKLEKNGFRHIDHQFEWTRKEFKDWCLEITTKYKNYKVSMLGIGEPPVGHEDLGFASQAALFVRNDLINLSYNPIDISKLKPTGTYKCLDSINFPFIKDERTEEEKLNDEIDNQIDRLMNEKNYDKENDVYKIPIKVIVKLTESIGGNADIVCKVAQKRSDKPTIENDHIVFENAYGYEDAWSDKLNDSDEYDKCNID